MNLKVTASLLLLAIVAGIIALRLHSGRVSREAARQAERVGCRQVAAAYRGRRSDTWLTLSARIERVLSDTSGQYRHQRFVVRCQSGQTVLIVNDVSIGQRVPAVVGAAVVVRGLYVWNALGGLVHFTHHDPGGGPGGWIFDGGRVFSLSAVAPPA